MQRILLSVVAAAMFLALASCSGSNRLSAYSVRGKVLVDGKPYKGIRVYFWPEDRASKVGAYYPQGETDENGEYVLTTYEDWDGAPPGA